MNKTKSKALTETKVEETKAAVQAKRYDKAFQQEVVANWSKTGRSGTQIAAELGVSYPSLKDWKRHY